ncbi:hypothetical protein C8J56DRAFT_338699 [Mycena floridula]|nr:hypothetical protein C8J56DRAFT_338699 [Mycena floridula]
MSESEEEVTCSDEVSARSPEMIEENIEEHQGTVTLSSDRFPTKVLALIFSIFCTVDFWDCKPFLLKKNRVSGSMFREPFVIATVCRRWRHVALSTPSLWSTIMLGGLLLVERSEESYAANGSDVDFQESQIPPEEVLKVALRRSAQHPLRLWIASDCSMPSSFTTILRQICSRIEQMFLGGMVDPFESRDLVFDSLTALQLSPGYDFLVRFPASVRDPWMTTAPLLRTLAIHHLVSPELLILRDWSLPTRQFGKYSRNRKENPTLFYIGIGAVKSIGPTLLLHLPISVFLFFAWPVAYLSSKINAFLH